MVSMQSFSLLLSTIRFLLFEGYGISGVLCMTDAKSYTLRACYTATTTKVNLTDLVT